MPIHERTRRGSLGRGAALVIAGVLIGALLVPPVSAHVGGWAHNWKKHIRPKTDSRYFTKAQANSRFVRGYEMVDGISPVNSNSLRSHTVQCPEGKVAIGGGSTIAGAINNVILSASRPTNPDPTGWTAIGLETGAGQGDNWYIHTFVLCAFAGD